MKTKDFTVVRDAHGDLILSCPKQCRIPVESHVTLGELVKESQKHLKTHGQ